MRTTQEIGINESIAALKEQTITEAQENLEALKVTETLIKERLAYYKSRKRIYQKEKTHLRKLDAALGLNTAASGTQARSEGCSDWISAIPPSYPGNQCPKLEQVVSKMLSCKIFQQF